LNQSILGQGLPAVTSQTNSTVSDCSASIKFGSKLSTGSSCDILNYLFYSIMKFTRFSLKSKAKQKDFEIFHRIFD
jgi:hypothetical protein